MSKINNFDKSDKSDKSDENSKIAEFNILRQKYKNDVDKINLDMKKKYFEINIMNNKNQQKIQKLQKISCLDDTYNILFKNKTQYELSNLECDFNYTNNIHVDIVRLCKIVFGIKYFDDNDFKIVKSDNELNYLNPKAGDSIIYNSIRKSIFLQSDFRVDLNRFEEKLKSIMEHHGKQDIKINFFEDEEYTPLVWVIIEITQ